MVQLHPTTLYFTATTLLGFKFTDLVTVLGYALLDLTKNSRAIS